MVRKTPDRVQPIRCTLLLRKSILIAALVVGLPLAACQLLRPLPRLELVAVGPSAVTVPGAAPALRCQPQESHVAVAGIGTVGATVVAQEELHSPGPIRGPSMHWRLTRL
ncbi:MAG: hypothetical protein HKL89_04095 [Candidatus Dormibacteraeota bacterium]|nr:hypothetical protein [Candidatus Dormibacteraeota bacterium]